MPVRFERIRNDLAWRLWRDGYRAVPRARAGQPDRDAFHTRILGRRALVVRGSRGAREFYDSTRVMRRGAVPALVSSLIFGRGAVHGMDGADHLHRKQMFLRILDDEAVARLVDTVRRDLDEEMATWELDQTVPVFDVLVQIYGAAALAWAGVEVDPHRARTISDDLAAILDGFGVQDLAFARAWTARLRLNWWAAQQIRWQRAGGRAPAGSALAEIAAHRGNDGRLLSPAVAGVELLNVLRPTVAVAYLGAFAVLGLGEHPDWREELAQPEADDARRAFAHEVRRVLPFVPAIAGLARQDTEICGTPVSAGDRILLDVPGTDHDPATWRAGARCDPDQLRGREPGEFEMVPQGGGHVEHGHRCPGEPLAIALTEVTVRAFAERSWELEDAPSPSTRRIPVRLSADLHRTPDDAPGEPGRSER